ncbi:DMT family transporter [Marinilabilia rubra]|uniref:EamA family transporter n=1 Tax=Marinilabilia rubra TaxID=2162893 RepID=A0A2U2BAY3_9BACT|nr:DMT family transporter [Marinilabilia rubra]PWE00197.1 EamA family transporter [Marinilabilia rubra]
MWLILTLGSAFFLGFYDILKKVSLRENAVWPVLFFGALTSTLIFIPLLILSEQGVLQAGDMVYVPRLTPREHWMVLLKTSIVLTSWVFNYFALKHLPLTIVAPIRATGPLWTLIGAIIIFGEQLSGLRWLGLLLTLFFFFRFSTVGKLEGLSFRNNKWMWFVIIGTLAGAVSGLYDKHILRQIDRVAVQAWFSFYQVILLLPILWFVRRKRAARDRFYWRWSIPLIGLFLVVADFLYFYALSEPESLISVVSALRRASVIVPFVFGALMFGEQNVKRKAIYLAGIMVGIVLLLLG